MKVAVANDHAGYPARQIVLDALREAGHEVIDFGAQDDRSVDYPDYAQKACRALNQGDVQRVILMCGTGKGMPKVSSNSLILRGRASRSPGQKARMANPSQSQ